jgi:hypothetical protein
MSTPILLAMPLSSLLNVAQQRVHDSPYQDPLPSIDDSRMASNCKQFKFRSNDQ